MTDSSIQNEQGRITFSDGCNAQHESIKKNTPNNEIPSFTARPKHLSNCFTQIL